MTKESMIAKLNRKDITGAGVKVTTSEGYEIYYFYEDFGDDKGIDRAARQFQSAIDRGTVRKAEYIYK